MNQDKIDFYSPSMRRLRDTAMMDIRVPGHMDSELSPWLLQQAHTRTENVIRRQT